MSLASHFILCRYRVYLHWCCHSAALEDPARLVEWKDHFLLDGCEWLANTLLQKLKCLRQGTIHGRSDRVIYTVIWVPFSILYVFTESYQSAPYVIC
jgi:hypothetical protein